MKIIAMYLIDLYRMFSRYAGQRHCRFYPTCSAYTRAAIERYGFIKGSIIGIIRLLKCHPFHQGGYDPLLVPPGRRIIVSSRKT